MTWLIILVILLVAFGPVLWLVPSKRDRRLTRLRAQARAEGLIVELKSVPKLNPAAHERVSAGGRIRDPKIECATYQQPLTRKTEYLPGWCLLRNPGSPGPGPATDLDGKFHPVGELPGWSYLTAPERSEVLSQSIEAVKPLLGELPEDVVAVELSARTVAAYWLESPGSDVQQVAEIAAILRRIEAKILALDEQIRQTKISEDS